MLQYKILAPIPPQNSMAAQDIVLNSTGSSASPSLIWPISLKTINTIKPTAATPITKYSRPSSSVKNILACSTQIAPCSGHSINGTVARVNKIKAPKKVGLSSFSQEVLVGVLVLIGVADVSCMAAPYVFFNNR